METRRILFNKRARSEPLCGVARKTIAWNLLTKFAHAESCLASTYALGNSVRFRSDTFYRATYLFDYQTTHAVPYAHERVLYTAIRRVLSEVYKRVLLFLRSLGTLSFAGSLKRTDQSHEHSTLSLCHPSSPHYIQN